MAEKDKKRPAGTAKTNAKPSRRASNKNKPSAPKKDTGSKPKNGKSAKVSAKSPAALKSTLSPRRSLLRRTFKWAAIAVVVLCALPILLTFLYWPSSVQPVSTLMIAERIKGNQAKRDWVGFEDISPFVWQSVVSSEDGQYCAHDGVDWSAINTVIDDALDGDRVRGASTIPMQTVKNLYLWSSRSYVRKVLEVPLAMLIDTVWGKRRTMEIYLNIAEWGPGIYGIEAAAQHHFNRSAKRLTRRQAALLAVTLPNPATRNPAKPGRGLQRLARLVEKRARASGAYVRCLRAS